jgi:hypothetical protein
MGNMQIAPGVQERQHPLAVPATMQAAVYRGVNDVRVEMVPVPAIGSGEVAASAAPT